MEADRSGERARRRNGLISWGCGRHFSAESVYSNRRRAYNNQLFRVIVDYGRDRTDGMTDADMIEAISAVYGTSVKRVPGAGRVASRVEIESGSPVARWEDAGHAVVLYRTSSYREAFRLIMTEPALADLAGKAAIQAMRLDEQEAPGREIARQKKERDDGRAADEKARIANKGVFRP